MICLFKNILCSSLLRTALLLISIAQVLPAYASVDKNPTAPFTEIDDLVTLGAPALALKMLEKNQSSQIIDNVQSWMMWEKKRIELMQTLHYWKQLVARVNQATELWKQSYAKIDGASEQDIDAENRNWLRTQQIKAYLKLANEPAALALLQQLLWSADEHVASDSIASWRRLVIQCYLQMNKVEDAQRAMRRYQQDYGSLENEDGVQWTVLQMQLLLRTGRYQEVILSLSEAVTGEEKAILLIARLESGVQSPQQVKKQLNQYISKIKNHKDTVWLYDFVLLKVAIAEKDLISSAQLIEKILIADEVNKIKEFFYDADKFISADSLWSAYEQLAYQSANTNKLLRGDDESWYQQAGNWLKKNSMQSKAMYSVLAFTAKNSEHRELAFEQLLEILDKQESGIEIINALFAKTKRITNIETVPAKIRYRLVDYALSHADLKSAAKLMEGLSQPPVGEDVFAWDLRRARILIMSADYPQGVTILQQLLIHKQQLTEQQVDQFMQVLFDLQAIEQHEFALQLFNKLGQYALSTKVQREIAFWEAESYQAKKEYEQAAYLFLKSARPLNDDFDPWFHTASFKAAESLTAAGLLDDARRQYIKLLRITTGEARKSVIKQRLQQLRLLKSKALKEVTTDE